MEHGRARRRGWKNSEDCIVRISSGCLEVMATDKKMGVENEGDEWPTGEKSK